MDTRYGKRNRVSKFNYLEDIIEPKALDRESNEVRMENRNGISSSKVHLYQGVTLYQRQN